FAIEYDARRIDPSNDLCTRTAVIRLVYATGALSSDARILRFGPLRHWAERRLLYEREHRPLVRSTASGAGRGNLETARENRRVCDRGTRRARRAIRARRSRVRAKTRTGILQRIALPNSRAVSHFGTPAA